MHIYGIYNIGSRGSLSKANIFIKIAKKLNLDITRARLSINNIKFKADRPKSMTMSIANVREILN